jgi:pimeloyl-ACP methyl ester carboxylesterase
MLTENAPRTSYVSVPTLGAPEQLHRMAVHHWGNENNPSKVVCVHGLTRNARDFDMLAAQLSTSHHVICVDIAGRGKSDWLSDPAHYTYPDYASDMLHLLAQLGIARAHWVGTSMGGIIGMLVANKFPQFFASLTLNDIGCHLPLEGLARIATYVHVPAIFDTRAEAEASLRQRLAIYGIPNEACWQHLFTHSIEPHEGGRFRLAYDPRIASVLPTADKVAEVDLWPFWEPIKAIPTLLIRGAQSDLLTADTARAMAASHSRFVLLEVAGVGHAPSLMVPEQLNTIEQHIQHGFV